MPPRPFDHHLFDANRRSGLDPLGHLDDEDLLADDDDDLRDAENAETDRMVAELRRPPRSPETAPRFTPAVWLKATRMTQTEASLRLAVALLRRRRTTADVVVALTGGELTRAVKPRFPVMAFLRSLGFQPPAPRTDWRARFTSDRAEFGLVLHNRLGEGDVVTTLAAGHRFVAEVAGGPLKPTRSPTEHRVLRAVIARAITSEYSEAGDVLVAVVPRSERFRDLATRWGQLPRFTRTGVSIVFVDRAGTVRGCAAIDD